jgi:hypothetical protein
MTSRDLAAVVLRVAGLYLVLQVIAAIPALSYTVPYLLGAFQTPSSVVDPDMRLEMWRSTAFVIWPPFLYLGVALWLLRRTRQVAERLVRGNSGQPGQISLGLDFQPLAISIVGVALLAHTVPQAARTAVDLVSAARFRDTPLAGQYWDRISFGGLLELGTAIFVGLWLCLGARGIAKAIQSLRASNGLTPSGGAP